MEYIMITCDCGCGGLSVTDISSEIYPDKDDLRIAVEVSPWMLGVGGTSVKDRLRHIWHIIRNGHPYTDLVILNEEAIGEMVRFMLKAYDRRMEGASAERCDDSLGDTHSG